MNHADVLVIGGGLAGLSAALTCADAGARVVLVEARARLGGAACSFRRGNLWIDNGQHVFLRCCTAYRGLLDRLGTTALTTLQPRLSIPVLADGRRARLRRNRLPAPLHLAGALARYPFLAPRERARAMLAARALAQLDPADPALDQRTFGDWLAERRQSPRAIASLWDLIAVPALNLPADQASLALAAMVFRTGLLDAADAGDLGYARAPLAQVHADPAAEALRDAGGEVLLGARAGRIDAVSPEQLSVAAGDRAFVANAVVLAVPHAEAAALLEPELLADARRLHDLGASPIVNVHVIYDRTVTDLPFAASLHGPVEWVFDRTATAGLTDGQYLAVSLSSADRYLDRPVEAMRSMFLPALARLFPAARDARVRDLFVTRERAATFRQAPRTRALRPGAATAHPRLFLAGAWTDTGWPATMEGAVRSGLTAGRLALTALGRPVPQEVAA